MTVVMLRKFGQFAVICGLGLLAACNPIDSVTEEKVGQSMYLVEDARTFSNNNQLGLKDILVYPKAKRKGPEKITTNCTNKELTYYRCTWCHECGYTEAFDYDNFGTEDWNPVYRGEAWQPIVQRMNDIDEALLNETIAERIYSYLHDETLGIYKPEEDKIPAVRVEVDDLSMVQVLQGQEVDDESGENEAQADDSADSGEAGQGSSSTDGE